jgi:hypothetical protein
LGRITAGAARAASVTHRRFAGFASLVGITALLALGLAASSAMATTGHALDGAVGTPGNDPGSFGGGGPSGLAIRQSTGDVYAADPGHLAPDGFSPAPRIERFDAAGTFQSEFAINPALYGSPGALAIDPAGSAKLYVGAFDTTSLTGAVLTYSAAGVAGPTLDPSASGTTFPYPVAVAVDPADGTVFVGATDSTTFAPVIDVFDNTGTYQTKFDGSAGAPGGAAFQSVSSLAVDGSSRLYVADGTAGKVSRYSTAGTYQSTVAGSGSLAAHTSSGALYVLESGTQVGLFSPGGAARQDTFGAGAIGAGTAIAVNETTGTVYVSDAASGTVQRFTTFAGPTVTTAAGGVQPADSATLHGTINPEGIAGTTYHFDYGADQSYGSVTEDVDAGGGSTDLPATATITGLTPNTTYHVRLVGTNPNGTIRGADATITTAAVPPQVDGTPPLATAITADGATLNGAVAPLGSPTTYHFDYGTDTSYGSVTPDNADPLTGQESQAVAAPVTGLAPGTLYHFRVSADNGTGGVQTGADQTFTTAPAAAAGASSVTGITAVLAGTVNPHGSDATFHFEYGLTTDYGSTTPESSAGAGNGDAVVSAEIARLKPGTTYHVRVVAIDLATGVTTTGVDGTFTTNPEPAAVTGPVTGVTTDHATFSGTYDTHGIGGSYQFVVRSTTSPFQTTTTARPVTGAGPASAALDELPPGETYEVRLAVTSSGVTVLGDAVSFPTAALPAGAPPTPRPAADASPYGCAAPVLAAYDQHPKPGDTITIAGSDLGVGGSVLLGDDALTPAAWSAAGFTITLPGDAKGALPLTVNCGKVSNTIAVVLYQPPSNAFTATARANGRTATVSVKVPGPGAIAIKGAQIKSASQHAGRAATYRIKVTLTSAGARSLRRHRRLAVSLAVRFTPTGGSAASETLKVTFRR